MTDTGAKYLVTAENYYSLEANNQFMSVSVYNLFMECPAKALGTLSGDWQEPTSTAMLVGGYVDAHFAGDLPEWKLAHPECCKKDGDLKAEYKHAETMIKVLETDPLAMSYMTGEKQAILTGTIGGVPWKGKLDVYLPGIRIVDLKTTKSIRETQWSKELGRRVSFIEQYNYFTQVAVYLELERQTAGRVERDWLDFYMVAVSKEQVPDKEVIDLSDPDRIADTLAQVEDNVRWIDNIRRGVLAPTGCGVCDYCRTTKKLVRPISYKDLEE